MHQLIRLGLAALFLCGPCAMAAAEDNAPLTHGSVTRDYARITFEWPEQVYFNAWASGNKVTISFDRKANPQFAGLLAQLYPYVTRAERKADGKTIVLTLNKPYPIRTFVSETTNGIDLMGITSKNAASRESPKPKPKPAPKAKLAAATPLPPAINYSASEETAAEISPDNYINLAPAAGTPKAENTVAPAPAADLGDSAAIGNAAQLSAQKPGNINSQGATIVSVSAGDDSATLRFPFSNRMGMAVFSRMHMLWIVFNKPVALDISEFSTLQKTVIGKPELLANPQATIIRMPMDDNAFANVTKETNSFEWTILVTQKKRPLEHRLKINVETQPPAPAHVFIPALEMADPVTVRDPQVGDELVITPLFTIGEGVGNMREFIEFTLLSTAQGISIAKKADDVAVTQLRNGLRVSLPRGASLTPGLPEAPEMNQDGMQSNATLFPYDTWKPADPEKIREEMQMLFHRMVESENAQESNEARLHLAQLYLAVGMAPEAMALLDGIGRTNPPFYRSAKLNALRGAANFLMYRFTDAARDFAASELSNNKEVNYWRSMLADLLGNSDQSYDYLALNQDYISKYPPIFRQRLAIVAADRAIGTKDYNAALKIFDSLAHDNLIEPINNYVNFLMAKISADTGQEKDAMESWDKLAEDYKYPFVRSRAEFTRIVWEMEHGTMPKDKAAERLERLRLTWHGDSLELQVLTLLGEIYLEKKDYINAMRTWNDAIQSFPNTSDSIDMARKMEEAFIVMFNDGVADNLSPLEALALYYEYRSYTPAGNTGNEMIERLADRLVAIDLLSQAESLLEHQMHYNTEKEQRSKIGVKLATVYMLNHQYKKALSALQDSVYGGNSEELRTVRNRLTAAAMTEAGQLDAALQTLGQDNSPDAQRVRMDVYWRQKDWAKLITSVEAMLKARKDITAPITQDESIYLLKLALAYVFENDMVQLQYLRDYFGPLMASNPNRQVFDFITNPDVALTPTNFDDIIKNLSDTRVFISNYKAHIKAGGLGAMLKP